MELNDAKNVTLHEVALSDGDGETDFLFAEDHSTQGKIVGVEQLCTLDGAELVCVHMKRLDTLEIVQRDSPDVFKIDVEGAAGLVLGGARETVRAAKPYIYIELHGPVEKRVVADFLTEFGYTVRDLQGRDIDDLVQTWASPIWCTVDIEPDGHVA